MVLVNWRESGMRGLFAVACVAGGLLIGTGPSLAQATYPPDVEAQCQGDYFKYCSPYALGSDELRRCMEAKGKSLSRNCQQPLKDGGFVKADRVRKGG